MQPNHEKKVSRTSVNPLDSKGNYSATSNNTKLVHWPLMGGLLHLVQRGGAWAGCGPAQSSAAVPNATAHPSTASVPITVLLYDGPLLCGFNVAIKGLTCTEDHAVKEEASVQKNRIWTIRCINNAGEYTCINCNSKQVSAADAITPPPPSVRVGDRRTNEWTDKHKDIVKV